MLLKRMWFKETIPRGYRVAYYCALTDRMVCAPLGLHWIVRVAWHAWRFTYRCPPSRRERYLFRVRDAGFQKGWDDGFVQGKLAASSTLQTVLRSYEGKIPRKEA